MLTGREKAKKDCKKQLDAGVKRVMPAWQEGMLKAGERTGRGQEGLIRKALDLEYKTSGRHGKILSQTQERTVVSWMDMPATFEEDWVSHSSALKKQNCDVLLLLPQFSLHTSLDHTHGKEMEG